MAFGAKSFQDTYNKRRRDGVEGAINAPKIILRHNWGPLSRRGESGHEEHKAFGYQLVRSDLEEEMRRRELPELPIHAGAMRERTTVLTQLALRGQPQGPENTTLPWVDKGSFHAFSGSMICINALLIGLETEIDTPAWFWVEEGLLIFFVFELVVRLIRHGVQFFKHPDDRIWNIFDFFIVLSGVCDQWLIPLIMSLLPQSASQGTSHDSRISVFFMLMRMLRLLRIVRLFRLVKIVRPLYELAQGILESLQGMFWILIFLGMTLYFVAIMGTRLIGHGDIVARRQADDKEADELDTICLMFGTVGGSMFALFGTMSSWSLLKFVPLFDEMPMMEPLFVIFYVYSAWAMLAVMTGVVSENMIAIREQMVKEDEQREEMRRSMATNFLKELFQNADTDNSGTVSKQEFEEMLRCQDIARKIEKNTHLKIKDLEELFDWLDHDGSGTITIDEFMKGFKWVNEPLRAKSLVKLQERLTSDLKNMEVNVTEVLERRSAEAVRLIAAPLKKVHAITEQMQTLDVHFGGLRSGIKDQGLVMPSPQDIRDVECRLTHKLADVLRRLSQIEIAVVRDAVKSEPSTRQHSPVR